MVFPTICQLCTDFLTRPAACLPACLPAYLSIYLSVCLSVPACAYLSMPTVHAYCLCLPVYAYLSVPTCLCLPICAYLSVLPVYAYLSVIWGKGRPDQRLRLIRSID